MKFKLRVRPWRKPDAATGSLPTTPLKTSSFYSRRRRKLFNRDTVSEGGTPRPSHRNRPGGGGGGSLFGCMPRLPTLDSEPCDLTAGTVDSDDDIDEEGAARRLCDAVAGTSEATANTDGQEQATVSPASSTVTDSFYQRLWNAWRQQFGKGMKKKSLRTKKLSVGLPVYERTNRTDVIQTALDGSDDNPYTVFRLKIRLREAHGLAVKDASGSSDPYVKFKYKDRVMYKSNTIYRSLNPVWDEEFAFIIDDPTSELKLEVYDYDRFMMDDSMGSVSTDMSTLKLFEPHDLRLDLSDDASPESMGYVQLTLTITPLTDAQKADFLSRASRGVITEVRKSQKTVSVWLSAVNIVLVEANLRPAAKGAQLFDPYVKFKLGSEKCKSKTAVKTLDPQWTEQYDLHIYDENTQILDIMVRDKATNSDIGGCAINLKNLEREKTYERWHPLDNDAGSVLLLLTISGTSVSAGTVEDLNDSVGNRNDVVDKYSMKNAFTNVNDVGHLTVKVFRAEGLASADIGGKSDPFCVLELVNARLQTHTEYKTLNPEWNKLFTFAVKDINEVLEVTVYDEDPNKKFEFLGKVSIPLMKIRNCGRRWYHLKDRKLEQQAKGKILLEMDVLWNPVKAALRTFKPRERKFVAQDTKFKPSVLMNAVNRLKNFFAYVMTISDFVGDCLSWKSYPRSICAFLVFVFSVYFFEIHHLPIVILLFFVRFHFYYRLSESFDTRFRRIASVEERQQSLELDDDEFEDDKGEKSTSLTQRVQGVQEVLQVIQTQLDFVACLLERVRNTFNFTVPYLSYVAITVLCIAATVLYLVPLRWLIMVWGINKFRKRLFNPHFIDNNELLDFLSRVPSDRELKMYRELKSNYDEPPAPSARASTTITTATPSSPGNGSAIVDRTDNTKAKKDK